MTHWIMQKYYCENDVEAVISRLDDDIIWLGTGEHEYDTGRDRVAAIFRRFAGQVPKCNVWDEEYEVLEMAPGLYLCSGRAWIATDASTGISLRVHQRVTMAFRRKGDELYCCHIHISNPYEEMTENDVGFPEKMAQQSCLYLQEQIELQKKKIAEQTALLERMSYEDSLTGVFNRNKFNHLLDSGWDREKSHLGIVCFDLNGLKQVNDQWGHGAGDDLLRRAAKEIRRLFDGKIYRMGGDEFVVLDALSDEDAFWSAVRAVCLGMEENGIDCALGGTWRMAPCSIKEQIGEADRLMYAEKRRYYRQGGRSRGGKNGPGGTAST